MSKLRKLVKACSKHGYVVTEFHSDGKVTEATLNRSETALRMKGKTVGHFEYLIDKNDKPLVLNAVIAAKLLENWGF